MTRILGTTRLRIRDQSELLNQIAGTYKDFYRAAMEYVDNAVDAARQLRHEGVQTKLRMAIEVDTKKRQVSFVDNCGGMSPDELCRLLSHVGRSSKKTVPWANGQFGFGVHAFRAFAKEAVFVSRKKRHKEAVIRIDRALGEKDEVECVESPDRALQSPGTKVRIGRFDTHVFKKASFVKLLAAEIEHHFDDVLRTGLLEITIAEQGRKPYQCSFFDYSNLPGEELKKTIRLKAKSGAADVKVDLKILDRVQDNRLPVLINKGRRIQAISDLRSFKAFLRSKSESTYVWSNPLVVGGVEISDLCSPNLTRDDLKDSAERETLYEALCEVQHELKDLIDDTMNKKTQESFRKVSTIMSKCLAEVLRKFRLRFEQLAPAGSSGNLEEELSVETGHIPFGGDQAGGGGPGPDGVGSGGVPGTGTSGPGSGETGGGDGHLRVGSMPGASRQRVITAPGPKIEFQSHAGEGRVIDLGNSLIVNTQHPDFILRNPSRTGHVKFDIRLLNYIAAVVSPYCVQRLFERRGKVATAAEVGSNILDLALRLEANLAVTVLGEEIGTSA